MYRPATAVLLTTLVGLFTSPTVTADEQQAPGLHLPGVSAKVTLDYVSQYFFRGIEQLDSDTGVVIQPGAEFTLPVVESVTATIGTWGSIHTDGTGQPAPAGRSNPSTWFEQDLYASLDHTVGDFTVGVGLTYYTFPSRAVNGDITELNLKLGYDDSDLFGKFAFNPYVEVAIELQNNAFPDENSYLEVGGAFEFDMADTYDIPLVWSIPIVLGLSLEDYYTDASGANETFGYLSVGLFAHVPLSELLGYGQWMGAWDLHAGVTFLFLNSSVVGQTDNFADSSDNYQVYATVGVSREW